MNTLRTKEKSFLIVVLLYTVYMVFPLFQDISHIPVWAVCVASSLYMLFAFPKHHNTPFFKWFIAYVAVLLCYCVVGHNFHINGIGDSNNALWRIIIETAWILPNILICNIFQKEKNQNLKRIFSISVICILVISLFSIIPSLLANARILRLNASEEDIGMEGFAGLPSYTLMSCYAYFIPVICYAMVNVKGLKKVLFVLMLLLFGYVILKTEITTSFIAMILMLLITMTYSKTNIQNTIGRSVLLLIAVYVFYKTGWLLRLVDFMQEVYAGTNAEIKFQDFHNQLVGEENDNLTVREHCREMSMECFYHNPVFGSTGVGGHSSLLDRLGSMGLFGFIPYFMMLITNIKSWYNLMPGKSEKFFYFGSSIIVFVFLYNKGLFSGEGMMFMMFLVPVCILGLNYYIQSKKQYFTLNRSK